MRRIWTVIRKEFIQLRREPRLIGFVVVGPLLFLFLFGVALRLQFEDVPMAIVDDDRSYLSMQVKDELWGQEYFVVEDVPTLEAMRERLDRGEARIGVHIPREFSKELFDGGTGTIHVYTDGTMPTVAIAMEANSKEALGAEFQGRLRFDDPDADRRPPPEDLIALDVHTLYNEELRDAAFFLPGVIGILVMQVGLVLASSSIVREREYQTMEQLLVVPLERYQIILGKLLPYAVIAFTDYLVIMAVGQAAFELPMAGSRALLFVLTALYVMTILGLGLLISTVAQTQQQAIFGSVFVLIPSILLSGFVFPVEAMPSYIQPISQVIPLTHYLEIIRGIMLKGVGIEILSHRALALAGLAAVTLTVATLRFRRSLGN